MILEKQSYMFTSFWLYRTKSPELKEIFSPMQINGYDCGMYLLLCLRHVSRRIKIHDAVEVEFPQTVLEDLEDSVSPTSAAELRRRFLDELLAYRPS